MGGDGRQAERLCKAPRLHGFLIQLLLCSAARWSDVCVTTRDALEEREGDDGKRAVCCQRGRAAGGMHW
jgi:hypothetical protein